MSKRDHPEPASSISFVVSTARLPQKGMPVKIEANAEQLQALAAVHGLVEVKSLRAELQVVPWKRNGVRVEGIVRATVVQQCVVTLDPLENSVEEQFEQVYLPQDSKLGRRGFEGGGEIMIDPEGDDAPETFSGDAIDVGALAEEHFGLAIDPYPRKPGVTLQSDEDQAGNPFKEKLGPILGKS